ncbi:hypothetical protein BD779DRAFT_1670671 [Infundibulicybe gibba]|nr:hypothetical protein BD779DRAFT_1670671 [Infundibulicybe gibba]
MSPQNNVSSPDVEAFSTPPTTPGFGMEGIQIQPSLSRRNSRPTSLHLDQAASTEWNPDIVLERNSPIVGRNLNGGSLQPPLISKDETITPELYVTSSLQAMEPSPGNRHHSKPMDSPCFVHSHLDRGALTDWLRNKNYGLMDSGDVGVARSLQQTNGIHRHYQSGDSSNGLSPTSGPERLDNNDEDEDEEFKGSLTKQLAETAATVREMSKQLGRARVRSNIQTVLIVTKARDNRLIKLTRELAIYLMLKPRKEGKRGLIVYVDNQLRHSRRFDAEGIERDHPELFMPFPRRRTSSTSASSSSSKDDAQLQDEGQLRYWTSDMCSHSPHLFDFVVTLGGDGTVLFTSWLFQRIVPPVLPFALGSLGFLTNFDFADHQAVMDSAIDSGIRVNLRMRFTCTVYRAVANEKGFSRKAVKKGETGEIMMKNVEKGGWEALEGGWTGGYTAGDGKCNAKDKEIMCFTTRPVETFEVLNDLVVDRGPSPYVSLLELFGDEHHMTTVQADGLTVSTPTGSTAYSLSAGGSLVHPEIPALLITPICPHTLSFRPMLLPDSMELRICVPYNSRSTAWASFDGRGRVELKQGDHIKVTASKYPFPTVCADKQSTDWFHAISRTLKWNERERQKSFVVVEEGPAKLKTKRKNTLTAQHARVSSPEIVDEVSEDEEDEVSDEEDDTPAAEAISKEKAQEIIDHERLKTPALKKQGRRTSKSRSRSRPSGNRSGVDSPSRFAGNPPHPPVLSPRHVEFTMQTPSPTNSSISIDSTSPIDAAHHGTRDDIHTIKQASGRSRIPRDRDVDLESIKTPTANTLLQGRTRGHSRTRSTEHRAFAVWGHDESDSNASDSDV